MGGGKGGSSSSEVEVPEYIKQAQQANIGYADDLASVGYMPWMGADTAAFNPMQIQAMDNAGSAASAFGLAPDNFDATGGIPAPTTFADGTQGYSSYDQFQNVKNDFAAERPNQAGAYDNLFIDPIGEGAQESNTRFQLDPSQDGNQNVGGNLAGDMGAQLGYEMGGPEAAGLQQQGMSQEDRARLMMSLGQGFRGMGNTGQQGQGQQGLMDILLAIQAQREKGAA